MEEFIKQFIIDFAENKGIAVEQLVSIELGKSIKYTYIDGNNIHVVEGLIFNEPNN